MRTIVTRHRRLSAVVSALLIAAAIATVAFAQSTAPPQLAYTFSPTATPAGPTTAAPGPTTFVVTNTSSKDADFTVLKLHDGADPATVQTEINKQLSPDQIEAEPFDIVGGTSAAAKGHTASFLINLAAGTYLVANTTADKTAPSIVLTVSGDPNGATVPAPATIIGMYDYKYKLSQHISRSGAIRVSNKGKRIHMMIAFKAQNAAGAAKLQTALRKGDQKASDKLIRGEGTSLDPISPGQSVVLPAAHYSKGSYVFVCFWQSSASKGKEHARLGMTKIITVK